MPLGVGGERLLMAVNVLIVVVIVGTVLAGASSATTAGLASRPTLLAGFAERIGGWITPDWTTVMGWFSHLLNYKGAAFDFDFGFGIALRSSI